MISRALNATDSNFLSDVPKFFCFFKIHLFFLSSAAEFDEDEFLYGDSNMESENLKEEDLEHEPSL